jgi:DNA-binding response OmpR family regulator
VLLDLMLPGVSGFELLQRIREFSGVPVIFVTARDQDEDTVQALKMGGGRLHHQALLPFRVAGPH